MFFLFKNKSKRFNWTIRILTWGLLFLSPVTFIYSAMTPPWELIVKIYIHLVVLLGVYYFNLHFLIPRLLFQRKYVHYAASAFGLLLLVGLFNMGVSNLLDLKEVMRSFLHVSHPGRFPFKSEIFPLISTILALDIGLGTAFGNRMREQDTENKQKEKAHLKTELAFLKSQINPHFFFNTMNTIYALVGMEPEKAQEAIHKLSHLMRYVLYESEREQVLLEKEVAFLEGLLDLARMRLPEDFEIVFEMNTSLDGISIPPLLLVPFVENALKHGVSYDNPQPIRIALDKGQNNLDFHVSNGLAGSALKDAPEAGGLGLVNVKRRLDLLYGQEYSLDVREGENKYEIHLQIPLR